MAKIIDFNAAGKTLLAKDLLEVTKELHFKMTELGNILGSGYVSLIEEETTQLEKLSFYLLGFEYEDENIHEIYGDYLFDDITLEEFIAIGHLVKRKENE